MQSSETPVESEPAGTPRPNTSGRSGSMKIEQCEICDVKFQWKMWDDPWTYMCEPCHREFVSRLHKVSATKHPVMAMKFWKEYPDCWPNALMWEVNYIEYQEDSEGGTGGWSRNNLYDL